MTMPDSLLPHLADEQLSAALDGDDDEAVAAHLGRCEVCSARLAALRAAAALVATPTAPLPGPTIDHLISTALAAVDERHPETKPVIVSLRTSRRRPPSAWLAAAAAALMLLAGLGAAVRSLRADSTRDASVAASAPPTEAGRLPKAAPQASAAAATDHSSVRADLGEVDDTDALVAALDRSSPGSLAATSAAQTTGGTSAAGATASSATKDAAAPAAAGPPVEQATCLGAVAALAPDAGPILATATLRWQGNDAEVVVVADAGATEGRGRRALVLRRLGCDLLADRRF